MQPKNLKRLLRALSRQGLDVTYNNSTYSVRLSNDKTAPVAEVLLPESFPVEAKALKQLANLASVRHPYGGSVCKCHATPDFHPGDSGIAIGSVVQTEKMSSESRSSCNYSWFYGCLFLFMCRKR